MLALSCATSDAYRSHSTDDCQAMEARHHCPVARMVHKILSQHTKEAGTISSLPLIERAQQAGVSSKLKAIPSNLHERIANSTAEDAAAAKKELHAIQKHNHQIVARAEAKRLRQTLLPLGKPAS